jgi:hypothetical protein
MAKAELQSPPYVLFVGSGLSIGQGGPSWQELRKRAVHELIGHVSRASEKDAWRELAMAALKAHRHVDETRMLTFIDKPEFATWVIGELYGGPLALAAFLRRHLSPQPTPLHALTVEKVISHRSLVLTTDFDGLLRAAFTDLAAPRTCRTVHYRDTGISRPVLATEVGGVARLVELHGCIADSRSLVCYPEQVSAWRNEATVRRLATILAHVDTAVFWGCGGNDRDICDLFSKIHERTGHAFSSVVVLDVAEKETSWLGDLAKEAMVTGARQSHVAVDRMNAERHWHALEKAL